MVIREKDKAQHIFKWVAFRSPKIDLVGTQPVPMEIPSGFLVSPDLPYRFNIFFNDNKLFKDIRSIYNKYSSECYKVVKQLPVISDQKKLIEDFRKTKISLETHEALNRKCYWEPGDYSLAINVKVSKPDSIFTNNYSFSIKEDDSRNLRLNVITILEEPITNQLKSKNFPYNFAYLEYKDYKKTNSQ